MTAKSAHLCPVCGQPLSLTKAIDGAVILFCGFGACKSVEANRGALAETESDAFEELKRLVEAEELRKV